MTLTVTRAFRALAAATLVAAPLAAGLSLAASGRAEATTIQKVVSPGGIEAWLVEEHTVPLIAVNFAFEGGSTQDPPGKEGLANLLSTLLDEGAGDLDSQTFQSRIEDISVNLSFEDSRDSFYGELKTLAEARDEAFDLLRLSVTSPRFDADAIERMRVQAVNGVRRELREPGSIAGRATSKALFPNHPYGRPSNGTQASLQAISRDDLVDYHRRVFARDGLKIAVVGAIDAKTLAPLLDKTFGGLPAKGKLTPVPDVVPVTGATVAEAMAVPQTTIRFATDGLLRKDPDFIAAFVMNHILGGGTFSSWLYEEVREKRGLAYSVSTSLNPLKHAGIFTGGLGTRADKAQESLDIVRQQIKRMAEQGPTADELAKAKAFLVGSYALRFDSSDKIAGQLLAIQIDDLGMDYFDVRNSLIEKVTLEDVKRVAQKLLSKPMTVVTVGPQGS